MEPSTKTATEDELKLLDYWYNIPLADLDSLKLSQKIENSLTGLIELMNEISDAPDIPGNQYLSYKWSVKARNFGILLRDTILATTKFEQLKKDSKLLDESTKGEILEVLQSAAAELKNDYSLRAENTIDWDVIKHQEPPLKEIITQLEELQKQSKKIIRSSGKIDDLRSNITEYVKDFQMQYFKQINAVDKLFEIVNEVRNKIRMMSDDATREMILSVVDEIGDSSQQIEFIQSTESIDILPYANKEVLAIPVATDEGNLLYKYINVKSELARWFSSSIYPKLIELESKRDHAVEKCLLLFTQARTKIASFPMSNMGVSTDFRKELESAFAILEREILDELRSEVETMNQLVADYQGDHLLASNIYSTEFLFLPNNGTSQISSLGKDAQKRIANRYSQYSKQLKSYLNKLLSRYIEIERTPYSQYVKNKLAIYDEDDSMALFLKSGYLGKSFTVARPELIDGFLNDYNLWQDGFAGALLLHGLTGSGKSTLLGMINHVGLNEEIIQLKIRESYFIEHRAYEPEYNLKELIDLVLKRTKGRRIIISVDDLEQWHDDENELFDNINELLEAIILHRKRVFFIVTCTPFLKERIQLFKDEKSIFSSILHVGKMKSHQLRSALNLRARVNDDFLLEDPGYESRIGHILRESKGNAGYAMMEYCRYHNEAYQDNVKSQEFVELILSYHTLLTFVTSYHHCSIKRLSDSLSEMDFRDTMRSIEHLIGQKILVKPRKGYVSINPILVHTVEQILLKSK
jgi:energy-coupling factor transporter ATP-binding protein EcfA2